MTIASLTLAYASTSPASPIIKLTTGLYTLEIVAVIYTHRLPCIPG